MSIELHYNLGGNKLNFCWRLYAAQQETCLDLSLWEENLITNILTYKSRPIGFCVPRPCRV